MGRRLFVSVNPFHARHVRELSPRRGHCNGQWHRGFAHCTLSRIFGSQHAYIRIHQLSLVQTSSVQLSSAQLTSPQPSSAHEHITLHRSIHTYLTKPWAWTLQCSMASWFRPLRVATLYRFTKKRALQRMSQAGEKSRGQEVKRSSKMSQQVKQALWTRKV